MPVPAEGLGLVGRSAALQQVLEKIRLAARGRETTLIVGESGVGKELVARAVHQLSGDGREKFCAVNCAAMPKELMESELFGHRRGAFSGAHADHAGLIRSACCGTLYLDEVTELPPEAQAKLLRVIQEKTVRAVGELREAPVRIRFLASTNRPIEQALAAGALRRDLYYRLQRVVIEVPPLRERREDVPLLVEHFVERWRQAYGESRSPRFTAAAMDRFRACDWPGNVRELENVVFSACSSSSAPLIDAADLGLPDPTCRPELRAFSLERAEAQAIERALGQAQGNKTLASRLLGISRKQLYVKLRLYGLMGDGPGVLSLAPHH